MRGLELTPPRSCLVWPNGVPAANQAAYANFESYRYKFDPRDANAACVNVSAQLAWNTYNHSMYASYTNYTKKRRSLLQVFTAYPTKGYLNLFHPRLGCP